MGGVWVIGVDTDKTTNRPILPPVGVKREPGIEEQITQSALTGVYPGITPDVRVVDIPDQADRVLVFVRVPESIEAPHAIQNATRVYIRNAGADFGESRNWPTSTGSTTCCPAGATLQGAASA